jgi:hypothetical protein
MFICGLREFIRDVLVKQWKSTHSFAPLGSYAAYMGSCLRRFGTAYLFHFQGSRVIFYKSEGSTTPRRKPEISRSVKAHLNY